MEETHEILLDVDLSGKIIAAGIKQTDLARRLGIHAMTAWRKIHGLSPWRPCERLAVEAILAELTAEAQQGAAEMREER